MERKVAKKRTRSENWLQDDKNLLKELVGERVQLIENKNTDTDTNTKKASAWLDLLDSFNCMCKGGPRTVAQLKSQWGILKMNEKKKLVPKKEPETPDDAASWLPQEFEIDTNDADSVSTHKTTTSADIVENEIKCRRELHKIQVAHARELHKAKMKNLELEYKILKKQLLYTEIKKKIL